MALKVVGLMNVQFAIQQVMARTWFTFWKSIRAPRARALCVKSHRRRACQGRGPLHGRKTLAEQGMGEEIVPPYYSVKEAVFPFNKFPASNPLLGPEMKSTGEVMGVARLLAKPLSKASLPPASGCPPPAPCSCPCATPTRSKVIDVARTLSGLGFGLVATRGTAGGAGEKRHPGTHGLQGQGRPAALRRHGEKTARSCW